MDDDRNVYKEMMRIIYDRWTAIQGTPAVLAWAVSPDVIGVFDWYAFVMGETPDMSEFANYVEASFRSTTRYDENLSYCSLHGSLWCITCFHLSSFDG